MAHKAKNIQPLTLYTKCSPKIKKPVLIYEECKITRLNEIDR